ncbi:MAG TPA: hypothetical protein VLV86_14740 [Vicinamibacterales bacterium]|nr:hypothetical protein [Vicinamibacterales bacterium]
MRAVRAVLPWTIAAALTVVLPTTARAQNSSPPPPPPGATTQTPPPPPATTSTTSDENSGSGWFNATQSRFTAAGFVGANYGASATSSSVDFGGQVGYLYRGIVGGEFIADFAPNFNITNAFLANRPNVNAYMANVIVAAPLGSEAAIQPYVSAGLGGVQLRSSMLAVASVPNSSTTDANQTRGGGDIGFGVMGFAGNIGVRGDVRYYRAFSNNTVATTGSSAADLFSQNLLSGLDFWRANIGIAVRW